MVAATRSDVPAVNHELVRAQARRAGLLIDGLSRLNALAPSRRRVNIDLDHAWVRSNPDDVETRIGGRWVTFDLNRSPDFLGGGFYCGNEFEVVLEAFDRRHENANSTVTHLDGQRRTNCASDIVQILLHL